MVDYSSFEDNVIIEKIYNYSFSDISTVHHYLVNYEVDVPRVLV